MDNTLAIIRKLRAVPMTQTEISKRTGIPQPRVCRWEAGQVPAAANDALKLHQLLADVTQPSTQAELATHTNTTTAEGQGLANV